MWFWRRGQRAVEALGLQLDVPVKKCFHTRGLQTETREINLELRGYRVRVGGSRSRVSCWLRGFQSTFAFALNRADAVMVLDQPLPGAPEGLIVFTSRFEPPPANLGTWLADNLPLLRGLGLSRKESLTVTAGDVILIGEPSRATRDTLMRLADLADRLPRATAVARSEPPPSGRPQLVQFGDLTPAHFAAHPVWIQCHVVDYDEPWYDETDEETFRPWRGTPPASPAEGMLLVAAIVTLADGTELTGFLTPAFAEEAQKPDVMGTWQPQVFLPGGRRESFWDGGVPRTPEARARLYTDLRRTVDQVFPVRFAARPGLTGGLAAGEIAGFYSIQGFSTTPAVIR